MMSDEEDDEYMYEYESEDDEMGTDPPGDLDSDKEMDDSKDDRRTSSGSMKDTKTPTDGTYRIMDMEGVHVFMESQIEDIADVMDLDNEIAFRLLETFRFKKERMTDAFYNDRDASLIQAGVMIDPTNTTNDTYTNTSSKSISSSSSSSVSNNMIQCLICYDNVSKDESKSLICDHAFCIDCYKGYLTSQVNDGVSCVSTTCPAYKCPITVPRTLFKELLEPQIYEKYQGYLLNNFVDCHNSMRFCPAAGCDKVAIGTGITRIECACNSPFCFRCGEEVHDPADCDQVKEWATKCNNESETANWILANTKKCPKCNTRIEKNQGCNHMTCKICKYDFCWSCMQPWADHNSNTGGYYNCNRYTDKSTNSDEPVEKARAELERYLFYYQRFNNHNQSLRFANTQLAQTEKRMMEMQNEGQTDWIDVQFLKQAVKKVIDCRRTLKYTYVSGFFLENKTKSQQKIKNLFEHHQEMLEKNTESLSGATEKNYTELDRTEVINLTRVTDNLHKELIKCMMEGEDDIASSQLGDNDDDLISPSTSSSSAVPSAVNPNKKSKVRG